MSKILFSEDQIDELRLNQNVKNIAQKSIAYTDEFKKQAVKAHCEGESSRRIFIATGFRIDDIGSECVKSSESRREEMSHRDDGYNDMRHMNSKEHPRSKPRSQNEKVVYLKDKLEYLEQENEFLKK